MIETNAEHYPKNILVPYLRRPRKPEAPVSLNSGVTVRNSRGLINGDNVIH
jgi:hypothetical protein